MRTWISKLRLPHRVHALLPVFATLAALGVGAIMLRLGANPDTAYEALLEGAIGVAEENGAVWLGTQSSQTSLAPIVVAANQVYDWTVVLRDIVKLIGEGTYGGTAYAVTLANKGPVMDYNPAYDLPADVKALTDQTIAGIIDGTIKIELE